MPGHAERQTMRAIRRALADNRLAEPFRAAHVNHALQIAYAKTFLPKHCEGNPGGESVRFIRVERGLYRLKC
jgi:hypothetical protein